MVQLGVPKHSGESDTATISATVKNSTNSSANTTSQPLKKDKLSPPPAPLMLQGGHVNRLNTD